MAAGDGAGVRAAVAGDGTGRGAAAGLGAGVAATSAASPFTARVLILRGSLPAKVPLAAGAAGGAPGATLAVDGGLAFWFSGGNTTRGPDLALTSTGASSRGTIFSAPSPAAMRSGTLATPSPDGAGTTLVGPASALMIGGSPLRGDPT